MDDLNDISKSLLFDYLKSSGLELVNIGGIDYIKNTSGTLYVVDNLEETREMIHVRHKIDELLNVQNSVDQANGYGINVGAKPNQLVPQINLMFTYICKKNAVQETTINELSDRIDSLEKMMTQLAKLIDKNE